MSNEDSLQFVCERLRHHHGSPFQRELHLRPLPRVRRRFAVRLAQGEHHCFERVDESVQVHCTTGHLWITHDGDPKDVILGSGESYRAGREDAMYLSALQPCVLEIEFEDDAVQH